MDWGATDKGKSTIARIIAQRNNLQIYEYVQQDLRQKNYLAQTITHYRDALDLSEEERWIRPEPENLVQRSLQAYQDRFPLVIEELPFLPKAPMIVTEGFGSTPELVSPLLSNQHQAIGLFLQRILVDIHEATGQVDTRLQMSDPERAIHNLITGDKLLADRVLEQTQLHELALCVVDGSRSVEAMTDLVEQHFWPYLRSMDEPF